MLGCQGRPCPLTSPAPIGNGTRHLKPRQAPESKTQPGCPRVLRTNTCTGVQGGPSSGSSRATRPCPSSLPPPLRLSHQEAVGSAPSLSAIYLLQAPRSRCHHLLPEPLWPQLPPAVLGTQQSPRQLWSCRLRAPTSAMGTQACPGQWPSRVAGLGQESPEEARPSLDVRGASWGKDTLLSRDREEEAAGAEEDGEDIPRERK